MNAIFVISTPNNPSGQNLRGFYENKWNSGPSRVSGKSRRTGFPPCLCPIDPPSRCSRQPECQRRGPAPCLWPFGVHYI
ncbi:hypothetical protein Y032_0008g337 [Ancylostoma ceylanicum]|uniref:Uncharacterized protein n=1 Tax=Ancylostoma ceylanicum TaxID=53326 RepID=A0A016VLD7_9BILA|nr:hypothetical protein Y032_0008g337 [Ancylostoma ceylanicum]